jgi:hypothetical protein
MGQIAPTLGLARKTSAEAKNGSEWRIATGEWFFLEGSVPTLPKNFLLFKNCTQHSAPILWFALPDAKRIRRSSISVINHWLKPVA